MATTIKNDGGTREEGGAKGETAGEQSSFDTTPISASSKRKSPTEREKSNSIPSDAPLTPKPSYGLDPEQPIETPISSKATRFPFAGVSTPNLGSMAPGGKASDERTLAFLRQCSSDSGGGEGAVLSSLEAIDGSSLEFLRQLATASLEEKEKEAGEILIDEGDLQRIGGTMQQGDTLGNEMATAAATVASGGTTSQLLFSDVNSVAGAGDSVGLGASEHSHAFSSFVPVTDSRKEDGEVETHAAVGQLDEQESITTEASRSFSSMSLRASGANVIEPKSLAALLTRQGDNAAGDDDVTVATATKSRVSLFETVPEGVGGDDVDDVEDTVDRPRVVIVGGASSRQTRPPSEIRHPELVRNVSELTGMGGAAAIAAARAAVSSRHQLNLDTDDLDDDELTEAGATLTTAGTGFGGSISGMRGSPVTHPRSVATDAAVAAARRRRLSILGDEDMDAGLDLEPWQRVLFAELRSQREAINQCQLRIEELTQALSSGSLASAEAANIAAARRSLEVVVGTDRKSRGVVDNGAATARPQRADADERQRELPQAVDGNVQRRLTPLWAFLVRVLSFFQLGSSRLYRVFVLFREEAQRRRVRFFHLDFGAIFKMLFMYIILSSHGHRRRRRNNNKNQNDVLPPALRKVWNYVQIPFYVFCAILVYLSQIGAFGLLYDFFVVNNVPFRVFRGENINGRGEPIEEVQDGANAAHEVPPNDERPPDAEVLERNVGDAPEPAVRADPVEERNIPEAENVGLRRRRGQRDRGGGEDEGGEAAAAEAANAAPPPPQVRPQPGLPRRRQRNFVEGGIRRRVRNPHQGPVEAVLNGILGFLADVVYLFGSFFLSLLPTWHPEAAGDEDDDNQENNGNAEDENNNENNDGAAGNDQNQNNPNNNNNNNDQNNQ